MFVLLLCDVHLYYVFILSVSLSSESADDSDDVNDHFRPGKQNVQSARVLLLSLLWGCEEEIVRKKLDRFPKKRRRGMSLFFSPLIDRAVVKFKNLSLCCHSRLSLFLFASQICLKRSTSSSVLSLSLSLSK